MTEKSLIWRDIMTEAEYKAIEFDNVSRIYKSGEHELKALDSINFKLDEGSFVVILGPSGAG